MTKVRLSIDDAYQDFGFSAVSEEELKQIENKLKEELTRTSSKLDTAVETHQQKLQQLYQLIMPLLLNLQQNPEKEYIYWPNRAEKIKKFIDQVNKLVDD